MTIPNKDNVVCQSCGLWENCRHPFMKPAGAKHPKVLVVGEAPGEQEDKIGMPFVGQSGNLLRNVLTEFDLDLDEDVQFTNVVRCRPPDNKITKQAIMACRQFAIQDIADSQAKIIFLMGNSPLSGILGETGISNWNGSTIPKNGVHFIPLYHPAYILRDNSHMNDWLEAMAKALDGEQPVHKDFVRAYPHTYNELLDMEMYLKTQETIAYDVETNTLDVGWSGAKIIALSFAAGDNSYALPLTHPESWFKGRELERAIAIVCNILDRHTGHVIGHNLKFDLAMTKAVLGQWFSIGGDTMLLSHLLDSRGGIHGLKRLAGIYLGMYGYEDDLMEYIRTHPEANFARGGTYEKVPVDKLLLYNIQDSEAVYKLHPILYKKLSAEQRILYEDGKLPVSDALAQTQLNGLQVDDFIAKRYACIYTAKRSEALAAIRNDKKVLKIIGKKQAILDQVNASHPKRKQLKFEFNPGSRVQLRELYFDYYKIPILSRSEKTGDPSTRAGLYRQYEDKYPILSLVRTYNTMDKMLGTYLNPVAWHEVVSDDGRVHTTYNQHGTVTDRTSSSEPMNLQNIPTPEKEPGTLLEYLPIKNIFTHREWYTDWEVMDSVGELYKTGALVNADFSGMELRVFSSLAKCKLMAAILKSGLDVHRMVAATSMHWINTDDILSLDVNDEQSIHEMDEVISKVDKPTRYRYKWTNWTLLYGGNAYTLSNLYDIPEDEAEDTVKTYFDVFPEVPEFMKFTTQFAEEHGYIEGPFGFREQLPYINDKDNGMRNRARREAVNMPVQNAAGEITLFALAILDQQLQERQMRSLLVNTVHDSILGDCPPSEIVMFSALAKHVMENIIEWAGIYMPRLNFDWLICPLRADIAVGTHYGCEVDWEDICQKLTFNPMTSMLKSITPPSV